MLNILALVEKATHQHQNYIKKTNFRIKVLDI